MRFVWSFVIAFSLAGCTSTHHIDRTASPDVILDSKGTAYVSTPQDGRFEQIVYPQSGYLTAVAVSRAFTPHLKRTVRGNLAVDRYSALKAARAGDYTYLIQPEILHWEDRATEWSGLLDKIKVKISVINVASGKVLDVAQIVAQSKLATLGGDHPEHLLNEPIFEYADSLFR